MTLKFYGKSEWLTARIGQDAACLVRLRKPTTPEWVDAVNALPKIDAAVLATIAAVRGTLTGPVDLTIPGAEIATLARCLASWTLDLVGAEGADETPLIWSALDDEARRELWEAVGIDDLTHLWSCLKLAQMQGGKHLDAARVVAMAELSAQEPQEPPPTAPPKPKRQRKNATAK